MQTDLKSRRRDGRCSNVERKRNQRKKKARQALGFAKPAKPAAKKKTPGISLSRIKYDDLPCSQYGDGQCVKCDHYPNKVQYANVDGKQLEIIVCSKCGKQMRPRGY